jgi:hypothetical protein
MTDKTAPPNPLDVIPAAVQRQVRRALSELDRLTAEKQGYQRLGLGDRMDAELDALIAPNEALIATFRNVCADEGVDADAAIALLRAPE